MRPVVTGDAYGSRGIDPCHLRRWCLAAAATFFVANLARPPSARAGPPARAVDLCLNGFSSARAGFRSTPNALPGDLSSVELPAEWESFHIAGKQMDRRRQRCKFAANKKKTCHHEPLGLTIEEACGVALAHSAREPRLAAE